ncbi:MAG TPA: acylneuraminate cytidylyltransferase family protein [Gammaproteobacteria bacterium]|nr:acylneuraminate cytidylyltransferase family protein [Gammaproteobacteria bacterium]
MKTLCTICARGGSTSVKNKNIRCLRGKPLIAHSIIQAKQSNLFKFIAVSSDSSKIRTISKKWGVDYVIDRPDELAAETSAKLPAIQHAVLASEAIYGKKFDFIVDLDATAPLRTIDDIITSFKMFIEHPQATNLVSACLSRKSPYFNMLEVNADGFVELVKKPENSIHRRQDTPNCYDMNASIYIWKRDSLFNSHSALSNRTLLYVMPEERSFDIDSLLDWKIVKLLAKDRMDFS